MDVISVYLHIIDPMLLPRVWRLGGPRQTVGLSSFGILTTQTPNIPVFSLEFGSHDVLLHSHSETLRDAHGAEVPQAFALPTYLEARWRGVLFRFLMIARQHPLSCSSSFQCGPDMVKDGRDRY